MQNATDKEMAITLARFMTAGGSYLIPSLFVHFVHLLLNIEGKTKLLKLLYGCSLGFALLSATPFMIIDAAPKYSLNFLFIPGPAYAVALLFFVLCVLYALHELYKAYTAASGARRNQLAYLMWFSLLGYMGGSTNYFLVYDIDLPLLIQFGNYMIPLYVAATTYAIVKYRLMDITVVVHKGLTYAVLLSIAILPAYAALTILERATLHSIPPLFAGTLVIATGLWIVLKNPAAGPNRVFGLLCLAASTWLFSFFMVYSASTSENSLFWGKFVYVGVVYVPAAFYHFCTSFLRLPDKSRTVWTNYVLSTVFLTLIPTDYLVDGQHKYYWGHYPQAGLLHPFFVVYFAAVGILSLYHLHIGWKTQRGTVPREATRTHFVFWASLFGYSASIDFLQAYGVELYPTGFAFVSLWILLFAYAIARYQLLDISDFLISSSKALPYAQGFTVIVAFYAVTLFLIRLYTGSTEYVLAAIILGASLISAELLVGLQKRMEKVVGRAFFKTRYDAYETLTAFSKDMVSILDLKHLSERFLGTLSWVLSIPAISLFILDKEKQVYRLAAARGPSEDDLKELRIASQHALPRHLVTAKLPVVREELESEGHSQASDPRTEILRLMRSEVCLPLINKDRLVGFCNLGPRSKNQMFSADDLSLLTTLAYNAAIALDNALLYEDLKRSQLLMRRTDRLRSLETIAGGFAHEIRNPLTSIKTFIQLAPERKDDPEFISGFSKVVNDDVNRIERLIEEILDYARYMKPKLTEEDLNDIVSSCLYFVKIKAESLKIRIEKEFASDLPYVMLDRQHLKQILLNLLLNAMDAMGETGGRLTIRTHRLVKPGGEEWVQIEVADTGPGIPAAHLEHIFDPFYTTKHESGEREGTGLGLAIVHQIVQEHSGTIQVDSTVGKGTTFYINLPVTPKEVGIISARE